MRHLLLVPALALVVGCGSSSPSTPSSTATDTKPATATPEPPAPTPTTPDKTTTATLPDGAPDAAVPKDGDDVAVLETSDGRIVVKFLPDKAPKTVANFEELAKKGFYDGTKFHRIVKGFMIQGGDPLTKDDSKKAMWGTGGSGKNIDAEFNDQQHTRGILSMARSQDPNSASSQFYIVHQDSFFLDGQYTAFGQVVDGMKTVDTIADTPTTASPSGGEKSVPTTPVVLKSVKIAKWPVR